MGIRHDSTCSLSISVIANPKSIHTYYLWIFYSSLGITSLSIHLRNHLHVKPLLLSLPITKKEYIGAKYLIALLSFIFYSLVTTLVAFLLQPRMDYFNFEMLICVFLIYLFFNAIYLPCSLLYKSTANILLVIFISLVSSNTPGSWAITGIEFHPSFLISILLFPLSYYLCYKMMEAKGV